MAEPRISVEGDYPKDGDKGKLKQIASYYILSVRLCSKLYAHNNSFNPPKPRWGGHDVLVNIVQ